MPIPMGFSESRDTRMTRGPRSVRGPVVWGPVVWGPAVWVPAAWRPAAWGPRACGPALCAALVLAGCGDDSPTGSNPPPDPVREFWQGTFSSVSPADQGSLVLDLVRRGSEVTGELVFRSQVDPDAFNHLFVKGTFEGDQYHLGPNQDLVNYVYQFSVTTAVADSELTGTFAYSPTNLSAEIACRQLPVDSLDVTWSMESTEAILGLAYDGESIWASTLSDFMRLDGDGNLLSRVSVSYRPNTLWTSDALTSDGTSLWGHLPLTVVDGTGTHNRSTIIEFTKSGNVTGTYEIPHRTSGLATAGGELWSLPIESDGVYRFDDTGAILEMVGVSLPDLSDLDYDGTHFWAIGWFLSRLYQIDRAGKVIRVFDLPEESAVVFPAGIVQDGTSFWYTAGSFDLTSRIYKLTLGS